jgi:anaerobic selenocysteine-containing dehydrogenase
MIAATRDGKQLTLEGDYDDVVNGGSLCVKGMAVMPTHESPRRNRTPRYRAASLFDLDSLGAQPWDGAERKPA